MTTRGKQLKVKKKTIAYFAEEVFLAPKTLLTKPVCVKIANVDYLLKLQSSGG